MWKECATFLDTVRRLTWHVHHWLKRPLGWVVQKFLAHPLAHGLLGSVPGHRSSFSADTIRGPTRCARAGWHRKETRLLGNSQCFLRFLREWHHHMTMVILAHHFLVRWRQRLNQRGGSCARRPPVPCPRPVRCPAWIRMPLFHSASLRCASSPCPNRCWIFQRPWR